MPGVRAAREAGEAPEGAARPEAADSSVPPPPWARTPVDPLHAGPAHAHAAPTEEGPSAARVTGSRFAEPIGDSRAPGTDPSVADRPTPDPRHADPESPAGSSRTVAAAVAHVLAARAAVSGSERHGDARDRLLAVLLDDPHRAVGAAVDLQECQERIDRLTGELRDERGRLGDVLNRLASSGLRSDQLARLSGLSDNDVADLLRRNVAG